MPSYFFSFLWGIVILFSLIGWGSAVNRVLFPKCRIDWGQKAAWGTAFSIFFGGLLNVTWTISRITILGYLGAGLFLYWLFDIFKTKPLSISLLSNRIRDYRSDKIAAVGIIVVFFIVLLQYSSWVSTQTFNHHDDFHAYLVFPQKMLQTGSTGPDPFSERKITSSLGGQSFLQTFVLSMLSNKNINIVDCGLGMIIAVGLLLGYFKDKGTSKRAAVFILVFFLLTPPDKVNVTACVMPLALFVSLFRTLDWEELRTGRFMANACIIALLAAGICALKSNFIPACGIFFVLSYFFYIINLKIRKTAIYEFLIATSLVGVFLLPWMISMYQSSGTLLYPLLGRGYHVSVYGTFSPPWAGLETLIAIRLLLYYLGDPYIVSLVLAGFSSFRLRTAEPAGRRASLSLSAGALLGAVIVSISTSCYDPPRFFSQFVFAAIIISMIIALSPKRVKNESRFINYSSAFMTIFAAGVIIGSNWNSLRWYSPQAQYLKWIQNIEAGLKKSPLVSDEELLRYKKMQQSIPQDETVLTRLAKPFLLDFRRNKIFIADWPGGASPPPGMPLFKGAEALADYLNSKSIRYVAYSYANEADFQWSQFGGRLRYPCPWIRTQAIHTFDFQNNLKQLGDSRKRIYDDGDIFVLDMLSRRGPK
jgi:hypothetical protein